MGLKPKRQAGIFDDGYNVEAVYYQALSDAAIDFRSGFGYPVKINAAQVEFLNPADLTSYQGTNGAETLTVSIIDRDVPGGTPGTRLSVQALLAGTEDVDFTSLTGKRTIPASKDIRVQLTNANATTEVVKITISGERL